MFKGKLLGDSLIGNDIAEPLLSKFSIHLINPIPLAHGDQTSVDVSMLST
jgi:hypothetical protein